MLAATEEQFPKFRMTPLPRPRFHCSSMFKRELARAGPAVPRFPRFKTARFSHPSSHPSSQTLSLLDQWFSRISRVPLNSATPAALQPRWG
jgi:hypothetical protein